MKTAEQIALSHAHAVATYDDGEPITGTPDNLALIIQDAIEDDRAQRPTLDAAEFDQITEAMSALCRGLERGREYITTADARAAEELIRSKFGPALHADWND